jgi:ATP-binding cassette subfamily B protein
MKPGSEEEILKGYDPQLMKRILSYAKPYLLAVLLALLCLLMSTAGEMILPVLMRRAVDGHILPYQRRLDPTGVEQEILASIPAYTEIDGMLFFRGTELSRLPPLEVQKLLDSGKLSPSNFYIFPMQQGILAENLVHADEMLMAVRVEDMAGLAGEQVRELRKEDLKGLSIIGWQFFLALAAVLGFTFSQTYLITYVGQRVSKDLRTDLYRHTLGLSLGFIDVNPVGRLVTRITNDVETINELFATVITSILKDFSIMIGVMITLFLLSPRLALFTLICLPPLGVATAVYRSKAREAFRRVRLAVSGINAFLSERISGMSVIQMFAREKLSLGEFEKRNRRLLRARLREMYVSATFRPFIDLIATSAIAIIIYFGAGAYLRNYISLGVLIAFINLIRRFFNPVRDIAEKYNILQSAMAGSERVFDLMDEKSIIPQPVLADTGDSRGGSIDFQNVSFSYKEGETVLRALTFRVDPGETVAIVGTTGAGKTTITSVLTRLWDIQQGRILLDGNDISTIHTDVLRRRVQSVLQDVFIFSGTVADNIRLGSEISAEDIRSAAETVRADTFIERLPDGYDTVLQERGANLSTGQRQLISFARVLAHDPDVFVMDEATANVDTETEMLIQSALSNLLRNRTAIVIAHRLSTIREADRILVLHRGSLVEEGSHKDLLGRRGIYYNLYRMQFADARSGRG